MASIKLLLKYLIIKFFSSPKYTDVDFIFIFEAKRSMLEKVEAKISQVLFESSIMKRRNSRESMRKASKQSPTH